MTQSIRPSKDGGRAIFGDTVFGKYHFDLDVTASGDELVIVSSSGVTVGTATADFESVEPEVAPRVVPKGLIPRRPRGPCQKSEARPERKLVRPGDWFAALILVLSLGFLPVCLGCGSRRARMNRRGWPVGIFLVLLPSFWRTPAEATESPPPGL